MRIVVDWLTPHKNVPLLTKVEMTQFHTYREIHSMHRDSIYFYSFSGSSHSIFLWGGFPKLQLYSNIPVYWYTVQPQIILFNTPGVKISFHYTSSPLKVKIS